VIRVLDLFSGVGGFSLGLECTGGFKTVAFCEIEPKARKVLAKHWPDIPIFNDVTTIDHAGSNATIICGGFPCQDISNANASWGERTGLAGERSGLWRELVRAIRVVRPDFALVENVAALLGNGMGEVLGDLAEIGYDAEWCCVRACDIGAPHERDRVYLVAYPVGARGSRLVTSADFGKTGPWRMRGAEDLQSIADAPFESGNRWPQPLLRRMDDGLSGRLDRHRGIGNAVVPQIVEVIGNAILRAVADQEAA
jgi:DNA (cytosine-5)-methyltransferase 1